MMYSQVLSPGWQSIWCTDQLQVFAAYYVPQARALHRALIVLCTGTLCCQQHHHHCYCPEHHRATTSATSSSPPHTCVFSVHLLPPDSLRIVVPVLCPISPYTQCEKETTTLASRTHAQRRRGRDRQRATLFFPREVVI